MKDPDAFRTIGEAADEIGVAPHVLRFWEERFSPVKPLKRAGGRRYYRPRDIALLKAIRTLLHERGWTIAGVQRQLSERGVAAVVAEVNESTSGRPAEWRGELEASRDELKRALDS